MRLSEAVPRHRVIGLTALIDVVFLLLVFFMLASTFLKFAQVRVEGGAVGSLTADVRRIALVYVGKGRRMVINGVVTPIEPAAARLRDLVRAGRRDAVVVMRMDATVADMVWAVDAIRQSGFKTVRVVR